MYFESVVLLFRVYIFLNVKFMWMTALKYGTYFKSPISNAVLKHLLRQLSKCPKKSTAVAFRNDLYYPRSAVLSST